MWFIVFFVFGSILTNMRTATIDELDRRQGENLLTTGEAARLLNSSRQHVVDLCERGDLPFVTTGTHRRVRRADLDALRSRTERMTRDQERSLWIAHAVAGAFVQDPDGVRALGRENLATLRRAHPRGQAAHWLDQWQRLLDGPADRLLEALTSRTGRSRELRQNSPFAGVLTDEAREQIIRAHREDRAR